MSRASPTSNASHALRYLRAMDRWVKTGEFAAHLGIAPNQVGGNMAVALRHGEVERKVGGHRCTFYRMTPPKPARTFSIDWPAGYVPRFFEQAGRAA